MASSLELMLPACLARRSGVQPLLIAAPIVQFAELLIFGARGCSVYRCFAASPGTHRSWRSTPAC